MEAPGLALLEPEPHHTTHTLLDVVIHGNAIAIQEYRRGQGIETVPLGFGNRDVRIEDDSRTNEGIPGRNAAQL